MKTFCTILLLVNIYVLHNFVTYTSPDRTNIRQPTRIHSIPGQNFPPGSFHIQKEIPVLCYHNIKKGVNAGNYSISEYRFKEHMKQLADSGYHSILPDQLYQYLTRGAPLPSRPVILSFDDTHSEHFSIAAPVMEQYGLRGVFFVMTISIGKPNYMTAAQIRELSTRGHVIAMHTWDHQNVKKLQGDDWDKEITKPKLQLEKITGEPVSYFAYPSGIWDDNAIAELKKRGIKAAFQLYGKNSETEKLLTLRRIIVPGSWTAVKLQQEMKATFK